MSVQSPVIYKPAVILFDPNSTDFEVLELKSKDNMLEQIRASATKELFRTLAYEGIYGAGGREPFLSKHPKPVLGAVPQGVSLEACLRIVDCIVTTDAVQSMLLSKGFNCQEWKEMKLPGVFVMLYQNIRYKRFEFARLTVADSYPPNNIPTLHDALPVLAQNRADPHLRQQRYVGVCTPWDATLVNPTLPEACRPSDKDRAYPALWVAIPQGHSAEETMVTAQLLFCTEAILKNAWKRPQFEHPQMEICLMLLDAQHVGRHELVQLSASPYLSEAEVPQLIGNHARTAYFREQKYAMVCDCLGNAIASFEQPRSCTLLSSLESLGGWDTSRRTWVAVPLGLTKEQGMSIARSLYLSDSVSSLLNENGFDTDEWRLLAQ